MAIKIKVALLALAWIGYGIWEYKLQKFAETHSGPVIRVDLLTIIPILLGLTIWVGISLHKFYKKKASK